MSQFNKDRLRDLILANQVEALRALLQAHPVLTNAGLNLRHQALTGLQLACIEGNIDCVRVFLERPDIDLRGALHFTLKPTIDPETGETDPPQPNCMEIGLALVERDPNLTRVKDAEGKLAEDYLADDDVRRAWRSAYERMLSRKDDSMLTNREGVEVQQRMAARIAELESMVADRDEQIAKLRLQFQALGGRF
eukprot:gnl/Hemi2/4479_TR1570_c0_g1_i1.p1 gnl/Hemi2/4479_TR1570_c0_g1~~gnl/Hemi2/4479_TR1570_c0_g1_i1.p1  ORF type:complete len:194 (-),score=44.14 gnl/Hemi2/4479_TR1570_c0_g1_i1:73-654(-)